MKIDFKKLVKLYGNIYDEKPYTKSKTVSFLIYKGKIVSFGVNSDKTSSKQNYYHNKVSKAFFILPKRHSEIDCLGKITQKIKIEKAELVIISKMKNGDFRLAKPCPACMAAIRDYGIKKVYYTTYSGKFEKEVLV